MPGALGAPGNMELQVSGQLHEAVEGLGVAQGLFARGLLRWGTGEYLLDRNLQLLAVEGPGDVAYGEDLVRHVAGGGVFPDAGLDPTFEVVIELDALLQDHEERHEGVPAVCGHVDDEAIRYLIDLVHGGVDLARPHPDAAAIYGRVGAAVDHAGPILLDLDPIPVPPHAGIDVEVALPVPLPLRIVPEVDGHGGHGLGNNELPNVIDYGVPVLVEGFDGGPEPTGLQFPRADRQQRHPADERRAQVCAAAGREQPQVFLYVLVGPLEALRWQRRARGTYSFQRGKVEVPARLYLGLHAGGDVAGTGPEAGHTGFLGELPQDVHVGVAGVTVVQEGRRSRKETAYDHVPHHPTRGGEPEEAVARPEVYVQHDLLEMLQQDTALALYDGLRQPRRA